MHKVKAYIYFTPAMMWLDVDVLVFSHQTIWGNFVHFLQKQATSTWDSGTPLAK